MGYEIVKTKPYIKIGRIKFNNNWFNLIKMDEWDEQKGADLRYCSISITPYVKIKRERLTEKHPVADLAFLPGVVENEKIQSNTRFVTGVLKLKPKTKLTYFGMNENEDWDGDNPIYVQEMEIYPEESWYEISTFTQLNESLKQY